MLPNHSKLPSNRLLLFMDILGTKHFVDNTINETSLYIEKTLALMEIIDVFSSNWREYVSDYTEHPDGSMDIKSFEPEISSFSDHIVVSFPASGVFPFQYLTDIFVVNTLINYAAHIHRLALERGFLARGGIALGWQRHTKNSIIGKALNHAVDLEKKAIYPRVIISDELTPLFSQYNHPLLKKDFDGKHYVSYLSTLAILGQGAIINDTLIPALSNLQESIEKGLNTASAIGSEQRKKWVWLATKFNDFINECINDPIKFTTLKQELRTIKIFDLSPANFLEEAT